MACKQNEPNYVLASIFFFEVLKNGLELQWVAINTETNKK